MVSWDGGGDGDGWNDGNNWSTNTVPTENDDVVISLPAANPTIDLRGGSPATIRSLQCDELLLVRERLTVITTANLTKNISVKDHGEIDGGEYTLTGNLTIFHSRRVANSVWHVTGAVLNNGAWSHAELANVQVDGVIVLNGLRGGFTLNNGTTFTELQVGGNESTLTFGAGTNITGRVRYGIGPEGGGWLNRGSAEPLVIAPGASVEVGTLTEACDLVFGGGGMNLINRGTIIANGPTEYTTNLTLSAITLINEGVIEAVGRSSIAVTGTWNNSAGAMRATGSWGNLTLGGTTLVEHVGLVEELAGGHTWFQSILNNSGRTFVLDETTDPFLLGGTLSGGTLAFDPLLGTNPAGMFTKLRNVLCEGALTYRDDGDYGLEGTTRFSEARVLAPTSTITMVGFLLRDRMVFSGACGLRGSPNIDTTAVLELRAGSATYIGQTTFTHRGQIIGDPTGNVALGFFTEAFNGGTLEGSINIPHGSVTLYGRILSNSNINIEDGHLHVTVTTFGQAQNGNAGIIHVGGNATFLGPYAHLAGSVLDVDGNLVFDGENPNDDTIHTFAGSLTVDGEAHVWDAEVTFNSPARIGTLRLEGTARFNAAPLAAMRLIGLGGTIDGTADFVVANGSTTTGYLRLYGTGRMIIPQGNTLVANAVTGTDGWTMSRPLDVAGVLRALGNGTALNQVLRFRMATGASVNVLPGGTFELGWAQFNPDNSTSVSSFSNGGTVSLTPGRTANLYVPFYNNGTVQIDNAGLYVQGGGIFAGQFDSALAGFLQFRPVAGSPSSSFGAGASIRGALSVEFRDASFDVASLVMTNLGTTSFNNSTAAFAVALQPQALVSVQSSSVTFAAEQFLQSLALSSGTVTAGDLLSVSGVLTWSGGTLRAGGAIHLGATGSMTVNPGSAQTVVLDSKFVNHGQVDVVTGGMLLKTSGDGAILNESGATFTLSGGWLDSALPGSLATVLNNGTLRRAAGGSGGIGTDVYITGAGTLDVRGTLVLRGGGSLLTGAALVIGPEGWLDIEGSSWVFAPGTSLTGEGPLRFLGGAHQVHGLLDLDDTLAVNAGTVSFGAPLRAATLIVQVSGRVEMVADGGSLVRVGSLSIADAGTLDLGTNDLLVDVTPPPGPLANVSTWVARGRAGGAWTGAGITSSAAGFTTDANTTLGVMTTADYRALYGPNATFAGEPLDDTTVLVKYTYYGDTDFSGEVDFDDFVNTDFGFNTIATKWRFGDSDGNGIVDFDDFVLIDLAFNTQTGVL